jgi:pimeloyl-ACP methyl ester carboxylesterase
MGNESSVRVNDIDVHYSELGSGPPVVLVHGGLATAEIMWNVDTLAPLVQRYRVIMPDSRGHGRTSNPSSTLSYSQMADDVAALCDVLGLERPAIVGYSDGAQIGLELGLRHPGVARAIVLGGVVAGMSPVYLEALAGMGFTTPGEVDLETMRAAFGDHYEMMTTPHANFEAFVRQISRLWLTVPTYTDAQLASIRDACLVICGDRDRGALDDAIRLSRTLGTAELAVVPNSEHGAASKPLFWTNVLEFLGRHS